MANNNRIRRLRIRRPRSLEEREILGAKSPVISRENFRIDEQMFVKGDLLPKSGKRVRDVVP